MKTENKQIKASSWALGILFVLSAAVLVLFFGFGYDETLYSNSKNLTAPHYTGLLLVWLYALIAICVITVLVFGVVAAIRNLKYRTKGQQRTGFAGWVFLLTFAVIVASYFLANTTPVRLGDNSLVETTWVLQLTDVCLYSIYVLVAVSVLCSILSMVGLFKARR